MGSSLVESVFTTDLTTFRVFGLGLSRFGAEEYIQSDRPLAWALAALMHRPPGWSKAEHRVRCEVRIHRAEHLNDLEAFLLRNCVETYLQLTESETKEHEMLSKHYGTFDPWEVDMTWADWVEMHARKEGVETGMRSVVLQQLKRKFGPLSDEMRQRVEGLSNGQIEELALSVLDAKNLEDLAELASNGD